MIDFRYHLVSIIAIFLALAIGLVVGASALQQPLVGRLQSESKGLANRNKNLYEERRQLQRVGGYNNQVVGAVAGQLLAGRLTGESVVFVEAPGSDDQMRTQLADMVTKAGARVSGYVSLQDKYLDDGQLTVLDELVNQLKPGGLTFPPDATTYDRAAIELADVLVTNQPARAGQEDPGAGQVLAGFKASGFLNMSGKPATRATLAVMIAPAAANKDKDADAQNKALASLASALDQYGTGTVAAGDADAAADGGMIKAIRDGKIGDVVSTVDTADMPTGQVTAVLALSDEKRKKTGAYGLGSGVDGPLPTPVPTVTKKK